MPANGTLNDSQEASNKPIPVHKEGATGEKHNSTSVELTKKSDLTFLSLNCCSLRSNSKRARFLALIEKCNPDIVCGCESHLDQSYHTPEVFPDHYNVFRKDRTVGGGGVFVCVKKNLVASEEPILEVEAELLWIKLSLSNQPAIHIGSFYRPPNPDSYPIEQLSVSLTRLNNSNTPPNIVLMGDFNFPSITWHNGYGNIATTPTYGNALNNMFLDVINDNSLEQFVHLPTRLENTLDLVFCTYPKIVNISTVPGISDHDTLTFHLDINKHATPSTKQHKIALYHKGNIDLIKRDLATFANTFLSSDPHSRPVEQLWQEFKQAIHEAVSNHVPHKVKRSRNSLPWINRQIKKDMKAHKKLYNKAKRSKLESDWKAYCDARNLVNCRLKEAHNNYYARLFDSSFSGNRCQFWKYVRAKRQDKHDIPTLLVDGKPVNSSKDKAKALNNHFQSVFTKENLSTIPTISNTINAIPDMPTLSISQSGIQQLLSTLDEQKSSGPDLISPYILKHCANEIAPILQVIFTQSLSTSSLSSDWLSANICPVYKKGNRSSAINYRPISLTSICAKTMEHIIYHSIMNHLNQHNVLIENQHGFRSQHSCVTQLITLTEDISYALDHQKQTDIILLDFSKAFDTVPHQRLLTKLRHYGISNSTLAWIESWLTRRSQCVVLDGETSNPVPVLSGVPQGTVLGPLMFLLYINDIANDIDSPLRMFADDCLLYRIINSREDTIQLQQDLNKLSEWANTWQLNFNVIKCAVVQCTRNTSPITHNYILKGHILETSEQHSYLGILINKSLSWSSHISTIAAKATKTLNFLKRNLSSCSQRVKKSAYITMVRPQMEYASAVWDPYYNSQIQQLEKVQHRAARWIYNDYSRFSSVSAMLNELSQPSLETRRKISRLQVLHKALHHQLAICILLTINERN